MPAYSTTRAVFVTDELVMEGKANCLLMGMAAHPSREIAIAKALSEYSVMALDHEIRPGWCQRIALESPEHSERLPDFHHAHSRDARNLQRIRNLCKITSTAARRPPLAISWSVSAYKSPIRFIKFRLVTTNDLLALKFGLPEPRVAWGSDIPLYHPLW